MDPLQMITCIALLYGLVIGSFLNVCIYRIPEGRTVVTERSRCRNCGCQLSWYDMIPVVSWLVLGGRCRRCRSRISVQYPLVEAANAVLYVTVILVCGVTWNSVIYCLLGSALIVLSVIDFRTYEIPVGINLFILALGLVHMGMDLPRWSDYVIGLLAVSLPLELIVIISRGNAMGGGDVKLMAAAGLLLGWKGILLAFVIGCIAGSVIHLIRMRAAGADRVLALGPYLAVGIMLSALWGDALITWYLAMPV